MPWATAACRTSRMNASSSGRGDSPSGPAVTASGGSTASGAAYSRSKADPRPAEVMRPAQNRCSQAALTSDQFHPQCSRPTSSACSSRSSMRAAEIGPRSRTTRCTSSTRSGCSAATRRMPPQASS
ncbi:hypothetical protein BJF82_06975 [Kytococcus sp. CUA-901]|nr:hypothetical protein BJF82_06975 [Kytococcus sp. CUA-901]